jgi:hypothetical protein
MIDSLRRENMAMLAFFQFLDMNFQAILSSRCWRSAHVRRVMFRGGPKWHIGNKVHLAGKVVGYQGQCCHIEWEQQVFCGYW